MKTSLNMMPTLLVLASLTVLGSQSSHARDSSADIGEFNFRGDAIVLPLVQDAMHPRVVVDVGDGEHYEFIIDTGAGVNVIDSSIADSQGYEVIGEMELGAPGGKQIPAKIVKVPLVHVGTGTLENAEFATMDIIGLSGGSAQGVIGIRAFSDYLFTYDIGGGRLIASRGNLSADEPGVIRYDASNGQVEIELDVAGTLVGTHVDTGSMGGLTLPAEMASSLPLKAAPAGNEKARLVGGERDIQFAQLDGSIQFAGLEYENQNIAFLNPSSGHGNIGGRILGDLLVSIDQQNHLIGFQKTGKITVAANNNKPRRLGLQFRGTPGGSVLTLAYVDPGSIGEKAGLVSGDVLLMLNDKPTEQYGMSDLRVLFGGSDPLTFGIERDGVAQTIEIK